MLLFSHIIHHGTDTRACSERWWSDAGGCAPRSEGWILASDISWLDHHLRIQHPFCTCTTTLLTWWPSTCFECGPLPKNFGDMLHCRTTHLNKISKKKYLLNNMNRCVITLLYSSLNTFLFTKFINGDMAHLYMKSFVVEEKRLSIFILQWPWVAVRVFEITGNWTVCWAFSLSCYEPLAHVMTSSSYQVNEDQATHAATAWPLRLSM